MIGSIDIKISAHSPQIPLAPVYSHVGSPISIRILNVPKNIGKFNINKVDVVLHYPDGSILSQESTLFGGAWTATISGCETSGKSTNGLQIYVSGIDEKGISFNKTLVGQADLTILNADNSYVNNGRTHYVHLVHEKPLSANVGDFYINNSGITEVYLSSGWKTISVDLSSYATKVYVDNQDSFLNSYIQAVDIKADNTQSQVYSIQAMIPSQASYQNQLADKDFVNSSIVTNTAYFKGTYNSVAELPTTQVTPNDYAFVIRNDAIGQTFYDRYKYTAEGTWLFEYTINNSGFTAIQYAAINSGITSGKVSEIHGNNIQNETTKIDANGNVYILRHVTEYTPWNATASDGRIMRIDEDSYGQFFYGWSPSYYQEEYEEWATVCGAKGERTSTELYWSEDEIDDWWGERFSVSASRELSAEYYTWELSTTLAKSNQLPTNFVNLSGTFEDGTRFSYNLLLKN